MIKTEIRYIIVKNANNGKGKNKWKKQIKMNKFVRCA
jgi:hypothetical protein